MGMSESAFSSSKMILSLIIFSEWILLRRQCSICEDCTGLLQMVRWISYWHFYTGLISSISLRLLLCKQRSLRKGSSSPLNSMGMKESQLSERSNFMIFLHLAIKMKSWVASLLPERTKSLSFSGTFICYCRLI